MQNGHGGAREGAGRKPKALRFASQTDAAEQMIVDALPKILGKLISMAEEGDVAAARYLVDRILGRVSRLPSPPSIDKSMPYEERQYAQDFRDWERRVSVGMQERPGPYESLYTLALFGGDNLMDEIKGELERRKASGDRWPPSPGRESPPGK